MPHLAILVLLSSSGPPWLHFPFDEPSGSEKRKQKRVGYKSIVNFFFFFFFINCDIFIEICTFVS